MVSLLRSVVFLSHRRSDTAAEARNLKRDLERYGFLVFLDVDGIDFGASIRRTINEAMGHATLVLLLIGPRWLADSPDGNRNRLWDVSDWVRLEVESAEAQQVPVTPILVGDARFPDRRVVPDSLWPCLDTKALRLRHDDYEHDLETIVSFTDSVLAHRSLGLRAGRFGRRAFTRGDTVRLDSAEGSFARALTGAETEVVWGRQIGRVLGVDKNFVLVRWHPQSWAPKMYGAGMQLPVFGRPVMLKKTDLGYFDAWVPGRCLKQVRSAD